MGGIPVRGKAKRVLEAIPGMAGAKLLGRLSDGPTGTSFQSEQGGEQYVLRLDKAGATSLGLNRLNEYRVSKIVADAGLAPEPIYSDAGNGVYLRRFLPGRSWTVCDLENPHNLERLARLLRKVHRLPPAGDPFDPLTAARRYSGQLDSTESRTVLAEAERLMQKISEGSSRQALCHNDLVCQNILEREPLMLIDWEYAGIGDPFFDLAVVVQHHELETALAIGFLDNYLGRPSGSAEKEHL
ncbi:phosphotransferase, partial [Pseudomonadota bacterium]